MDEADTARRMPLLVRPPPLLVRTLLGVMNGADKRRFAKFIEAAGLGGLDSFALARIWFFMLVRAGNFNTLHVVIRSSWRSDMMARARGCP